MYVFWEFIQNFLWHHWKGSHFDSPLMIFVPSLIPTLHLVSRDALTLGSKDFLLWLLRRFLYNLSGVGTYFVHCSNPCNIPFSWIYRHCSSTGIIYSNNYLSHIFHGYCAQNMGVLILLNLNSIYWKRKVECSLQFYSWPFWNQALQSSRDPTGCPVSGQMSLPSYSPRSTDRPFFSFFLNITLYFILTN